MVVLFIDFFPFIGWWCHGHKTAGTVSRQRGSNVVKSLHRSLVLGRTPQLTHSFGMVGLTKATRAIQRRLHVLFKEKHRQDIRKVSYRTSTGSTILDNVLDFCLNHQMNQSYHDVHVDLTWQLARRQTSLTLQRNARIATEFPANSVLQTLPEPTKSTHITSDFFEPFPFLFGLNDCTFFDKLVIIRLTFRRRCIIPLSSLVMLGSSQQRLGGNCVRLVVVTTMMFCFLSRPTSNLGLVRAFSTTSSTIASAGARTTATSRLNRRSKVPDVLVRLQAPQQNSYRLRSTTTATTVASVDEDLDAALDDILGNPYDEDDLLAALSSKPFAEPAVHMERSKPIPKTLVEKVRWK